jgi:hypothetical protein
MHKRKGMAYMSLAVGPSREELEMDQIRADIALKRVQTQWEPWKALAAAFGAGATVATVLGGLAIYVAAYVGAHLR